MTIDNKFTSEMKAIADDLGGSNTPQNPVPQRPLPYVDDTGVVMALRVLGRVSKDADPTSYDSVDYKKLEDPEVRKQFLQEVVNSYAAEFDAPGQGTDPKTVDPGAGLLKIVKESITAAGDGTYARFLSFLDSAAKTRNAEGELPDNPVLYAAEVLKDESGRIDYAKLKDPAMRKSFAGRLNECIVGNVTQAIPLEHPIEPNLSAAYLAIIRLSIFNGNFRHTAGSAGDSVAAGYQAQKVGSPVEPIPQ